MQYDEKHVSVANVEPKGDPSMIRAHLDSVQLKSRDLIDFPSDGVVVIVGANNSGKSTLLRNIHAFMQSGSGVFQDPNSTITAASMTRNLAAKDLHAWLLENAARIEQNQQTTFSIENHLFDEDSVLAGSHSFPYDALQDYHSIFVHYAETRERLNYGFSQSGRNRIDEPASSPFHRFQDNRSLFEDLDRLSLRVFGKNLLLDDFPGAMIRIRVGKSTIPVPARNEALGEFGREVSRMPVLDEQGDGMRSFFSLMIPITAGLHKIIIADEPEAFLHPPQARALGRELGFASSVAKKQIIVATHDRNFIAGLIESSAKMTVIRLDRAGRETKSAQLKNSDLRQIWDDRDLRYSNILDGLFSKLVVLCESDQDCRFYEASLDQYISTDHEHEETNLLADEVLFVPVNGKARFAKLVPILQALRVPIAVISDIDLLREPQTATSLFSLMGGDADAVQQDLPVAVHQFATPSRPRYVSDVLSTLQATLEAQLETNKHAQYDRRVKRIVDDALRSEGDRWSEPKRYGFAAFRGDSALALARVVKNFDSVGLMLVEVGELEGFAPSVDKNRRWLTEALQEGRHRTPEAFSQIERLLKYYRATTSQK